MKEWTVAVDARVVYNVKAKTEDEAWEAASKEQAKAESHAAIQVEWYDDDREAYVGYKCGSCEKVYEDTDSTPDTCECGSLIYR